MILEDLSWSSYMAYTILKELWIHQSQQRQFMFIATANDEILPEYIAYKSFLI